MEVWMAQQPHLLTRAMPQEVRLTYGILRHYRRRKRWVKSLLHTTHKEFSDSSQYQLNRLPNCLLKSQKYNQTQALLFVRAFHLKWLPLTLTLTLNKIFNFNRVRYQWYVPSLAGSMPYSSYLLASFHASRWLLASCVTLVDSLAIRDSWIMWRRPGA